LTEVIKPGCFKDDGSGECKKNDQCAFSDECLSAVVDRRGPVVVDRVPGKSMEGGVVQR